MHAEVTKAVTALDTFATYLDSYWTDGVFTQVVGGGWNILPLSRQDMAERVRALATRLRGMRDEDFSRSLRSRLARVPDQIAFFRDSTLPQITGGNNPGVLTNFDTILGMIEQTLPVHTMPTWEEVAGSSLIPKDLARRIRSLEARIAALAPRAEDLEAQIDKINEAHAAATDLPTDLAALKEAREQIDADAKRAEEAVQELTSNEEAGEGFVTFLTEQKETAERIMRNIDSAYSAATTVGLAAAFSQRADQLSRSTWIWVVMLFIALVSGGVLGFYRINSLQHLLTVGKADSAWIALNAGMSVLSLAAPVWFAWLATRQIGQRFRLAEDYAFKASVSKAYEGFRREASRLDPKLEARLLASALDRLDEAPLRFISVEEHSSPYEALLASSGFQKLLDKVPSIDREEVLATVTKGLKGRRGKVALTGEIAAGPKGDE